MSTPLNVAIQLQALGPSPLPVAPEQPADLYPAKDKNGNLRRDKTGALIPAFTGKNPSYLDSNGIPHLVHHTQYQKQQPTAADLQLWFSNPANGVGCLGSEHIWFIDFDAKNFESEADCQARVLEEWLNQYPQLEGAQVEQTQSGGFRIWIKFEQPLSFTNFCLEPGGKHVGEILGQGRFAVLAPTMGTSGTYTVIQYGGFAVVPSAESIGLYPTKAAKAKPAPKPQTLAPRIFNSSGTLALDRLATPAVQAILEGRSESDDRSTDIVKAAREVYGWAEWCNRNGLNYHPTPQALIERCSDSLGIDGDRLTRILDGIDLESCLPSCVNLSGDEAAWKKVRKLNADLYRQAAPESVRQPQALPQSVKNPGVTFHQQAEQKLFGEGYWIAYNGTLYKWSGTHYEPFNDERLQPIIKQFADGFEVVKPTKDGGEEVSYPHAKPTSVNQVLEWVKQGFAISSELVNPPGINCTNGVLETRWEGCTLAIDLVPHDPTRHFYLSEPLVTYDLEADPSEYERLMQCLDAGSRDIFESTIAASLDLPTVRKWKGRAVRAVFLKGDGSNGKDTLRTITEMVLGHGAISSCSATDFKQYDQGRNFPIYPLRGKRVNWPSENADVGRVDELRGLRAAITGDPITFEAKNKMGTQEPCKAVFLFNVNEAPNLVAQLKATETRWGIVPFNRTYALHPQEGELQADPRFKEDPTFVQEKILPAFLNQLLIQLQKVVLEGIDYSCTQAAFNEMQREASHLLQFAHDTELQYFPTGSVTVAELWFRLREWYIQTGTLIVEQRSLKVGEVQEKLTWNEQPRRGDRNVKGSNQVAQRFLEIFPKAKIGKQRKDGSNTYIPIITGIKFCAETAQDGQDAQDREPKSIEVEGMQPSCPVGQLPKNCPRSTPQLPKMAVDDDQTILGSLPPILGSSCPDEQLPKMAKTTDKEGLQPSHLSYLGHLAQFSDKKLISDNGIDWVDIDPSELGGAA